jgi:hypothetical protein
MAKSDLLKQAIADAKTVKETALANAKIALQEAFAPKFQRMFAEKLDSELMGEEDEEMEAGMDAGVEADVDAGMGDAAIASDVPDSVNVGLDFNNDGEYDLSGMIGSEEEEEMDVEAEVEPMDAAAEYEEEGMEEDLNLEAIIRELEGDLEEPMAEGDYADDHMAEGDYGHKDEGMYYEEEDEEENIDEIIESILREVEEEGEKFVPSELQEEEDTEKEEMKAELEEAYKTVSHLKGILSEVNLLNAKLLYTNKLFRNFELSEAQKMKVIENFDRAGNTREVKLVFTTLAESFNRPTKKRIVKESYASKAMRTTAPTVETKHVLTEGFELANRWKKLAGLI